MKFLFDLSPVIAFFIGYMSGLSFPGIGLNKPIEFATSLAIVVSVIQIGWLLFRGKKVEMLQWISLALIILLGGATILFHNATFIFWKPSVLYWCMGAGLLLARYIGKKQPLKALMGKELSAPDSAWDKLNWAWALFFIALGFVNLYVAYQFSEAIWVKFKLFGTLGLTLLFAIAQGIWLSRQAIPSVDQPMPEQN